jgi:hypothetical protein
VIAAQRMVLLLLAVLAIAFLAACGYDGGSNTSPASTAPAQTTATGRSGSPVAESKRHHNKEAARGQDRVEASHHPAKAEKASPSPSNPPAAKQPHHSSRGSAADGCPAQLSRQECNGLAATLATGEKSDSNEPGQPQKCPSNLSQSECASLGKVAEEGGSTGQDLPVEECPAGLSPASCKELEEAASR